jgi:hypothetical protein
VHTAPISIGSQKTKNLEFHDRQGRPRQLCLTGDGAVEKELACALPQESFLASLEDARLGDGQADLARLGPGWGYRYDHWVPDGAAVRLGSPNGTRQELTSEKQSDGARMLTLNTFVDGVEHRLRGEFRNGSLDSTTLHEEVVLDASPAGLPVYCDGALLFDLPSAYSGGCSW